MLPDGGQLEQYCNERIIKSISTTFAFSSFYFILADLTKRIQKVAQSISAFYLSRLPSPSYKRLYYNTVSTKESTYPKYNALTPSSLDIFRRAWIMPLYRLATIWPPSLRAPWICSRVLVVSMGNVPVEEHTLLRYF